MEPIDKTPNLLDMGSQKVVAAYMADQMQDVAKNVSVSPDGYEFDIVDRDLFLPGTAQPTPNFIEIMKKIKGVTVGLEDANVTVYSLLFNQSVTGKSQDLAKKVASERLDLVSHNIEASFENSTVSSWRTDTGRK